VCLREEKLEELDREKRKKRIYVSCSVFHVLYVLSVCVILKSELTEVEARGHKAGYEHWFSSSKY